MFPIIFIGIPLSLSLAALAYTWLCLTKRPWSDPAKWPIAVSLGVYVATFAYRAYRMLTDTSSSTAIIGIYLVPTEALVAALLVLLLLLSSAILISSPRIAATTSARGTFTSYRRSEVLIALILLISLSGWTIRTFSRMAEMHRLAGPVNDAESLRRAQAAASAEQRAWVFTALAKNPATPPDVLLALVNEAGPAITESYLIVGPLQYGKGALHILAKREDLPVDAFRVLVQEENVEILDRLTANPKAPPLVLHQLNQNPSVSKHGLANNRNTPPQVLDELVDHPSKYVRRGLAGNPKTPAEALWRLSGQTEFEILETLAYNSSTPSDLLSKLALEPNEEVVKVVASSKNTPTEVLRQLSDHASLKVLRGLANNPKTPLDVLDKLAEHPDEYLRKSVARMRLSRQQEGS